MGIKYSDYQTKLIIFCTVREEELFDNIQVFGSVLFMLKTSVFDLKFKMPQPRLT